MTNLDTYLSGVALLAPQILVIAAILFTSCWDLFFPKHKQMTPIVSIVCLALSFVALTRQWSLDAQIFGGLFSVDTLTVIFSMIAVASGLIVVLMTMGYEHHFGKNRSEFYTILLTAIVAVMFLAGSTDLIMLFVSLETLSICCVLLTSFAKRDKKSGEASLKYLLSTAATTATLLYALSFIYGFTGSTSFDIIAQKLQLMSIGTGSLIKYLIIALTLSAIGFKLSVVPFHMWTPDVFEGAPTPVTAFLSIGSKAGGFVVALRFLYEVMGSVYRDWMILVAILALVSMVAGNLIALAQSSFKRMLAYSSIAHVGYMLLGLLTFNAEGVQSMLFYIIVYGIMNLGAFAGAILFFNETGSDRIVDMEGLIKKRPWLAIMTSICLLNLAGLPVPPAGFLAKLFIFKAGLGISESATLADSANYVAQTTMWGSFPIGWVLVICALITSIPAIYYYSKVVIYMIVPEPSEKVAQLAEHRKFVGSPQEGPWAALWLCTIAITLAGTFLVNPLMNASQKAATTMGAEQKREIGYQGNFN